MIEQQNKAALAAISTTVSVMHVWMVLAYGWYQLLIAGMFGIDIAGWLVGGVIALLLGPCAS